jgi:RNA polymerase sigma-70 factor (ECF subfamily)
VTASAAAPTDADQEAAAALRAGDRRRALELLMDAHGPAVHRYCRGMLRDPERAKDVLQKTFIQAYQALASFEGRSSLRTWLFSIARHRCLDEAKVWRRWARRATSVDEEEGETPARLRQAPTLEQGLIDDEWTRILARCVGELAPRARDAVVQRFLEGLSYVEMALVTGETAAALQARVSRALPVLRRCAEGAGLRP